MKSPGEKAMALVDGQLAPAEVPALVAELARNAMLVAELQKYLATSRSRLGQAFAAKADEPVPRRLVDAVLKAPHAEAAKGPNPAAFIAGRLFAWLRGSLRVPAWSLVAAPAAAAAAAFAIAAATMPAGREALQAQGHLGTLASAELGRALERTASGKDAGLATVRPMLSFHSKDAGWCRQFELRGAGRQTSHGVACRKTDGVWGVVALSAPSAAGRFVPAGADRRKVIDDTVTSMMVGDPLTPEGETDAISKGWQL